MSDEADNPVALRSRRRLTSDHIPRIVDLSLLTIQNRGAVVDGASSPRSVGSVGSIGADDVLTPTDVADVPGSADCARETRGAEDEDAVLLRSSDRSDSFRIKVDDADCTRKIKSMTEHQNRCSLPVKRLSEPAELFWRSVEAEHVGKRHSGPEGVLRRCSEDGVEPPRRRSGADLVHFVGPERARAELELPLRRLGRRGGSSGSDSSDADSFHTALDSPLCEAPAQPPPAAKTTEPARARQPEPRTEADPSSGDRPSPTSGSQTTPESVEQPDSSPGSGRQRAPSWRLGAGRSGAWYSNQNEDDHVYFFKEGSNSSTWTLPSAENGASQMARDTSVSVLQESVSPRPVPVGGVPSVLQVARGQRGRSLVYPPAPTTEPPPPQLVSGNQTHTILNQGTLNHTRLAKETSWRARKSWAPFRVVLTDRSLFLFKDTRGNAGMPPHWGKAGLRPDTNVDLAGAFVDWEREASSRKNVFQIRTVSGLRLLLQDDDALTANHWFDAIKRAIAGVPCSTNQLPVPRHVTADDRLTRSRSVRYEPVFGGHLAALCTIEDSTVPRFVTECIAAIEAKPEHLRMDGVYRASGNLSQVQRIRCEVDQDNYQVLYDEEDVHVLTGALKLFFRELKEPLIPFAVLPEALRAAGLTAKPDQVASFRRMVVALPPPNRDTLATLLAHLNRVTELQEFNRMHAHNLAIVFGPTLMWAEQESPDLALDLMRQNRVVEALLELRTEVFDSP
ncbi:Rho GTPase-activating protein 15 [Amphibalanus amphitrite]|uniref:Rho GTPase-activating protein 15 n=1 Tax=Amphibalanus amphitrite TaxID=1232801 RepID=A0A6A4VSH4_AMPAM|nr:Rho GTPase-activating protein 15 [Amphibalanus amphitrite]